MLFDAKNFVIRKIVKTTRQNSMNVDGLNMATWGWLEGEYEIRQES